MPGAGRSRAADAVRTRRDFPQLLTAIQAVAFLYQAQRERTAEGWVVATIEDYARAREIFAPASISSPLKGSPRSIGTSSRPCRKTERSRCMTWRRKGAVRKARSPTTSPGTQARLASQRRTAGSAGYKVRRARRSRGDVSPP